MKVIKRNGTEVDFDKSKIINAIKKARKDTPTSSLSDDKIVSISDIIEFRCTKMNRSIDIEEIQDMVENSLMAEGEFELARNYVRYRYKRSLLRKGSPIDERILSIVDNKNEEINQENSNKNPMIISTQRDYIAGEVSKDLSMRRLLPKDIVEAHKQGLIHFHDMDYFISHSANCCLVNLEDMLQNGTVISNTKIDTPKSFGVACNVTTQIMAQVASNQYGGQTISLTHLAPFVDVSRRKIRAEVQRESDEFNLNLSKENIEKIVHERLMKEIKNGVQTIQYQILTLMTTNGQTPFCSLFMYLNEAKDEKEKEDLALIIEEVLKQRIKGVKNKVGAYVSTAFPKLLYVLEEDNIHEGDKYWYLTELAAKCTAKRMVPDYISEKKEKEIKNGQAFPCMGAVDGEEVISYKIGDDQFDTTFEEAWYKLVSLGYKVEDYSKDSKYIITSGKVSIYDSYSNGFVNVKKFIRNNDMSRWNKILFKTDVGMESIFATDDHPFPTLRGRVYAEDLTVDDKLFKARSNNKETYDIESIIHIGYRNKFEYDVETDSDHFDVSGINSHNCRSFLPDWTDTNGKHKFYGRYNQGVCTINLVDVALSSDKDFDKFWKIFDERLELVYRALMLRHNRLKGTTSDYAPILWQHGAYARLKPGETIDKTLYGSYSSISVGYAGLYECTKYMTGKSHTDGAEGTEFALKVMEHLNKRCD